MFEFPQASRNARFNQERFKFPQASHNARFNQEHCNQNSIRGDVQAPTSITQCKVQSRTLMFKFPQAPSNARFNQEQQPRNHPRCSRSYMHHTIQGSIKKLSSSHMHYPKLGSIKNSNRDTIPTNVRVPTLHCIILGAPSPVIGRVC